MQASELHVVESYSSWTDNPNFGVATAAFLLIVFVIIFVAIGRWVMGTLNKKLDDMMEKNTKEHDKVLNEVEELRDDMTKVITWVNVDIKKKLNGDYSNDEE